MNSALWLNDCGCTTCLLQPLIGSELLTSAGQHSGRHIMLAEWLLMMAGSACFSTRCHRRLVLT